MLTVQYRMHPKIRMFPSLQFYEGKLADAKFLTDGCTTGTISSSSDIQNDQPPVCMPYHTTPYFQPYLVYDVSQGKEDRVHTSLCNKDEAAFAVEVLKRFQVGCRQSHAMMKTVYNLNTIVVLIATGGVWSVYGI